MEQNEGRLGGLCASRNGPKVNHLLFVYDSMLFIRNSTSEAQRLKQILHLYTQSSGQLVNYDKSTVYFSPSIPASDRDHISTILHIREVHDLGIYLGVPLAVGINKTAALGFVRDKGLGLLTLLATLPYVSPSGAQNAEDVPLNTSSVHQFHLILFFISLYLIAIAQVTLLVLNYVQENLSWVLGFAVPGIVMVSGLLVFVLGTTYRFSVRGDEASRFVRSGRVFVSAVRNRKTALPVESSMQDTMERGEVCSTSEVEEIKALVRLVPIWATSLIYAVVHLVHQASFRSSHICALHDEEGNIVGCRSALPTLSENGFTLH
ncbi:hypothetical protein V6N11_019521 [Hibiscus sabdariffa]|uniref:Uncharacterized protein n=1 Tax=Hibiscus sabdariffa TaxID=183260 RepID=A0ABR1ZCA3_9ROSI